MYSTGILNVFSRFMVNNVLLPSRTISTNVPLSLNITSVLYAEPLKRKRKIDPAVIRAREDRRRKKLEKYIRRLQKHSQQLKPISELEVTMKLKDELEIRKRDLPPPSAEKLEERAQLFKEWNRYKTKQHYDTLQLIDRWVNAQEKALAALRAESEELYLAAIQIDPELLPYSNKGPTHTPPIEDFEAPDGEYIDVTKKYEGET